MKHRSLTLITHTQLASSNYDQISNTVQNGTPGIPP